MKFLPLRDFDDVTGALNFTTPDCHVIGGCDLYTTKAAGSDKKLYRNIENSLESQYESLLRLSASLSPPQQSSLGSSMNLSRSSPFGPLSQVSSRRTFAYLIATLNASHPDYDFSHILRPSDFRRERSLKSVINTVDSTLYSTRPHQHHHHHSGGGGPTTLQVPSLAGNAYAGAGQATTTAATTAAAAAAPAVAAGGQAWGPRMWTLIDKEMALRECSVYCYAPEEDPYDGEERAVWSLNYFFFNKERKRVAYVYVRGVPVMTHGGPARRRAAAAADAATGRLPRRVLGARGYDDDDDGEGGAGHGGANKRARYWLGDRANDASVMAQDIDGPGGGGGWGEEDDYDVDRDDYGIMIDEDDDDDDDDEDYQNFKAPVRGVSEDIAATMELDDD